MERRIVTGAAIVEEAGKGTQGGRFHQDREVDHHQAGLALVRRPGNVTRRKTLTVLQGM